VTEEVGELLGEDASLTLGDEMLGMIGLSVERLIFSSSTVLRVWYCWLE
jgi:hypothetical protein